MQKNGITTWKELWSILENLLAEKSIRDYLGQDVSQPTAYYAVLRSQNRYLRKNGTFTAAAQLISLGLKTAEEDLFEDHNPLQDEKVRNQYKIFRDNELNEQLEHLRNGFAYAAHISLQSALTQLRDSLTPKQQTVLDLRLLKELTLDEMREEAGIHRWKVAQAQKKILRLLRHPEKQLRSFFDNENYSPETSQPQNGFDDTRTEPEEYGPEVESLFDPYIDEELEYNHE